MPQTKMQLVLEDVRKERTRQVEKWGGIEHDSRHSDHDFVALITKHAGLAILDPRHPQRFYKQMVRVAALAIAAGEVVLAAAPDAREGHPDG